MFPKLSGINQTYVFLLGNLRVSEMVLLVWTAGVCSHLVPSQGLNGLESLIHVSHGSPPGLGWLWVGLQGDSHHLASPINSYGGLGFQEWATMCRAPWGQVLNAPRPFPPCHVGQKVTTGSAGPGWDRTSFHLAELQTAFVICYREARNHRRW